MYKCRTYVGLLRPTCRQQIETVDRSIRHSDSHLAANK